MRGLRVTVIEGGWGPEADFSPGDEVVGALTRLDCRVNRTDAGANNLIQRIRNARPDLIFAIAQGGAAEDGRLHGLLDFLGLPRVGSSVTAIALCRNKLYSKLVMRAAGYRVPAYVHCSRGSDWSSRSIERELGMPVVVKPVSAGYSLGVTFVRDVSELESVIAETLAGFGAALVEEYVGGEGVEYTAGVFEDDHVALALPVCQTVHRAPIFSASLKRDTQNVQRIIPAPIPPEMMTRLQALALGAHSLLGLSGLSRTDLVVRPSGEIVVLEVNSQPGLTRHSIYPRECAAAGIGYDRMIGGLIANGLARASG